MPGVQDKEMITVGELFAGIGGIGFGLEMTGGFEVKWQVERDKYALQVLEKHWPEVVRHNDVLTFPPDDSDSWNVDLICGGFPCQDISNAGKREGLDGERSGLFYEIVRIAKRLRPKYLLLENVSALLIRGMGDVLGELASVSGDNDEPYFKRLEYHCIPAAAAGAPHRRDRVFILAYADSDRRDEVSKRQSIACRSTGSEIQSQKNWQDGVYTNPGSTRWQRSSVEEIQRIETLSRQLKRMGQEFRNGHWKTDSGIHRLADGVPRRVDRLRCLGNAVVPQVAQFIGEMILEEDRDF
jgi:DNA (cytosine-5)-methyltransferase 1